MSLWQRLADAISTEKVFTQGLKIIAIIVGALVVSHLVSRVLRRLEERARAAEAVRMLEARRAATAVGLAASAARWAIFLVAALMILREAGIEATPILAGAGVIGLAVGFGAQSLVRDVVCGFFMILEGQLAVGDKAEINGFYGVVEEVGLRTTRLVSPGGQVRYFGNGSIAAVVRYPRGSAAYTITVPLPTERADDARQALVSALADLDAEHRVFARPPQLCPTPDLAPGGRVARLQVEVEPAAKALFEAKAAARISMLLAERGFPLPAGREVSIQAEIITLET